MVVESVESLCQKARQAVAQGNQERARQLYAQALTVRSDAPEVHYGLATVCFQLGDLPNAAHHFREVTRLDPLRASAYVNLGAVYNRLDQLDDAIKALQRGIQLDTHRAEGYYNLGLAYRRKGQPDLAIQAYREATRLNPRMADAHLNLANIYLEKEQFGLSMAHYKTALETRPSWEKAVTGLAQAQTGLAALEKSRNQAPVGAAALATTSDAAEPTATAAPLSTATLDPERMVDPMIHGQLLTNLHRATIDSENFGRTFLKILEEEIEPAIKDLSSCLLYPNSPTSELDECVQKFELAVQHIRSAQNSLQNSIEKVRNIGEKLLKT
jgi:tetratricopeptide (TPR) repeat protein